MLVDVVSRGPFRVHMSDPAWEMRDQLPGPGRGAAKKYKVMSTSAICSMPTPIMHHDSVLVLWRLGAMQRDALRVVEAWGFTDKAEIVWRKMRRCGPCDGSGKRTKGGRGVPTIVVTCDACDGRGERPYLGMGHHVRAAHETAIIATRGRNIRLDKGVPSVLSARMPEQDGELIHSAKPKEIYDIIERLWPGPYVETFARNNREQWTTLGDQVPEVIRGRA
jgi:N6-adenosine-specific RNA methylase IME4